MTVLSKWQSIPLTCQDYVHPWSTSCVSASSSLLLPCLKESLRIYATAYSVALLMRGKVPSSKDLVSMFFGIIRSCIFLISHGVGFSGMACFLRWVLGSYNFYTASFIPSFTSSIISILIERPSRRPLLSLYVTNVASETLFRMAVSRNLVTPIPYGEVFIFSSSTAVLLYIYRKYGLPRDPACSFLKFLVGPFEECNHVKNDEIIKPPRLSSLETQRGTFLLRHLANLNDWFQQTLYNLKCGISQSSCPHPFSCSYYLLEGVCRKFAIGYVAQFCIKIILQFKRIMRTPSHALTISIQPETFRLAALFSIFTGIFRVGCCWSRKRENEDSAIWAVPAGFLAGLSFYFYRENSIALYFFWKSVQILYNLASEWGYLMEIPHAPVFFHAFSTAVLFHVAIMEPKNLRPSYWRFLQAMSGGRISDMCRNGFDVYGLESSRQLAEILSKSKK